MHDFVIRNARIANGLGDPLIDGDLGVKDGRVAQVGNISEDAVETLDAAGAVLAPGVIDLHTHYDAQLTWDATASPAGAGAPAASPAGAPTLAASRGISRETVGHVTG